MTDLDRYLDDFGERLARSRPRPLARRRRLTLAVAVTAAFAALAGLFGPARQPLDPVAEARDALAAPPGEIVYMKVTSVPDSPGAAGAPRTVELWSATAPPRWRLVQDLSSGPGTMGDEHGPIHGRQEVSYGNGEQRVCVAERDTLEVNQGFRDDGPAALVPTPLTLGSGDVQADLRTMLRDGEVSDLGEHHASGRTVRRLVSEIESGPGRLGRRLVYDMDPATFEPIAATLTIGRGDDPGFTMRMRVDAYERIAIDDTTVKLLEIQTTPRTKVTVRTPEEMRERERRAREHCREQPDGTELCPGPPPPDPPSP